LEAKAISAAAAYSLRVLVWGPSPTNAAADQGGYTEKRKQIKQALLDDGHMAFFSEELRLPGSRIPTNLMEEIQAAEADAVVIIASTHGSVGEAHEYGVQLQAKLLLWLPTAGMKSFTDEGARRYINAAGGRSYFFGERHLSSCVLTLVSSDFVNEKRYLQAGIAMRIEQLRQAAPIKRDKL
jgi:hypothetical protein